MTFAISLADERGTNVGTSIWQPLYDVAMRCGWAFHGFVLLSLQIGLLEDATAQVDGGYKVFTENGSPLLVREFVVADPSTGRRMRMPSEDFERRYQFLPYDERHCTGKLATGETYECDVEFDVEAFLAKRESAKPLRSKPASKVESERLSRELQAEADRLTRSEEYERELYRQFVAKERIQQEAAAASDRMAAAEDAKETRRSLWIKIGVGVAALAVLVVAVLLMLRLIKAVSFAIASGVEAARKRSGKD